MRHHTRERLTQISTTLLCALLEAGVISLAAFVGSKKYGLMALQDVQKFTRPRIRQALARYRMLGLVKFDPNDEDAPIVLTEQGFRRAIRAQLRRDWRGHQSAPWDHLWRVVLFDIPERWRVRRKFWRELKLLGFYKIQRSVYVHPHDCSKTVGELLEIFNLRRNVLVTSVADLGSWEYRVRRHFLGRQ